MAGRYYSPTRIIWGGGCIKSSGDIFRTLGRKALIVTGRNSAKINGSEKDVKDALEAAGIEYAVYDEVPSNPGVACAYDGAAAAKRCNADFIVAIGGGSPMDAGKAIALLAVQDIKEEDLFSGEYGSRVLPLALAPTTAGTGSEVTPYAMLTNDRLQTKSIIATEQLFPKVAFLDAGYLEQLPLSITVNTAMDALSHAVEGMLSVKASVISDALAVESIRLINGAVPELLKALEDGPGSKLDTAVRERLLLAASMAGMVITQTATTIVHGMSYSLTYFKEIDHGRACGLLLAEYLKLVEKERPDLTGRILKAMDLPDADGFKALTDRLMGSKETVSMEEIKQYAGMALRTKNMLNCAVKPAEKDIAEIYERSFAK